jgi:hypothetical protein
VSLKEKIALFFAMREVHKRAEAGLEKLLKRPLTRKEKSMLGSFLVSWKTSLIGLVMGAFQLHQGGMNWKSAAMAALMAALGLAAKDGQVTGGTIPQK